VVVDSTDCAVDLLIRDADSMCRIGRFTTDIYQGRHDLKNIVRPKSVSVMDGKIIVLASSQKDSSFIAVLNMNPNEEGQFEVLSTVGFHSNAYAFSANHVADEIIVVGKNPVGYDIHILDISKGLENVASKTDFHYHVPMQSERILASDPHGFGLALVAICVVFVALICIWLIMMLFSSIIRKSTEKKAGQPAAAKSPSIGAIASGVDGEVYAAIAAAIYAYEQDLHDEEDTIITIQKVERAWTPWNAKFYNMNHYFSNR
jgi:Na+-transporting methylmalonyl-CoA/oxaloacetate decarboxylase gamma subunit